MKDPDQCWEKPDSWGDAYHCPMIATTGRTGGPYNAKNMEEVPHPISRASLASSCVILTLSSIDYKVWQNRGFWTSRGDMGSCPLYGGTFTLFFMFGVEMSSEKVWFWHVFMNPHV